MKKSKSKIIAEKSIYAALNILKDSGGELRGREVVDRVREAVEL